MPSEQRLHPASLFFDLVKHAKAFALPALLVFFGTSRSSGGPGGNFGGLPDQWEVWLLVLFVPATLVSILRYLSFRLRYDERELVIRTGFIFRNERHIPYSRIQNVDAIQNVFHRFFGVVEVRVETGSGKEEDAKMSVLPRAAFEDIRRQVFERRTLRSAEAPGAELDEAPGAKAEETLLHFSLRELLLCGFLENKGMVLIGAAWGIGWETGVLNNLMGFLPGRGFFRGLAVAFFDEGRIPVFGITLALIGFALFLVVVRLISMLWALVRLYDFRLTRVGEDLRTEYGLFTKVTATVPIRRVQTITISAGPLHRLLKRSTVKVATAGGAGTQKAAHVREWLAPLIREDALPNLLHHVLPGFDLGGVTWQPIHPRAFRRAVKPGLVVTAVITLASAIWIGWASLGVFILLLLWTIFATRQLVAHIGWADGDEVVMMKSGWLWRQVTLARVNKIQAVAMHQSPFDRRAAMARVRVDTAGAGAVSHRVDIPYLDHQIAAALAQRLSVAAANTAFRW